MSWVCRETQQYGWHHLQVLLSLVYRLLSCRLGLLAVLARFDLSKDAELLVLRHENQVLWIAIAGTTIAAPGTDPDRASFSTALHAAREQVIQAAGVIAGETIDLAGTIGRHVLDNLRPPAGCGSAPRAVKRSLSRYARKCLRVDRRTYKATLSIDIYWEHCWSSLSSVTGHDRRPFFTPRRSSQAIRRLGG